ncbi:MAG: DUF3784 domain-containing protein [Clostridium sp.]|uniref:DUF3784 domain-containing protein n=1 Tax=Clostridium sp. TaxID=1506 RepID=UPI003F352AEF
MENILLFLAPALLGALAILIGSGKGGFLIAGYNTMEKYEQDKYDKKRFFKFMAKFLGVLALIQLVLPVCKIFEIGDFNVISVVVSILSIAVALGGVIYMNTNNRFKK